MPYLEFSGFNWIPALSIPPIIIFPLFIISFLVLFPDLSSLLNPNPTWFFKTLFAESFPNPIIFPFSPFIIFIFATSPISSNDDPVFTDPPL